MRPNPRICRHLTGLLLFLSIASLPAAGGDSLSELLNKEGPLNGMQLADAHSVFQALFAQLKPWRQNIPEELVQMVHRSNEARSREVQAAREAAEKAAAAESEEGAPEAEEAVAEQPEQVSSRSARIMATIRAFIDHIGGRKSQQTQFQTEALCPKCRTQGVTEWEAALPEGAAEDLVEPLDDLIRAFSAPSEDVLASFEREIESGAEKNAYSERALKYMRLVAGRVREQLAHVPSATLKNHYAHTMLYEYMVSLVRAVQSVLEQKGRQTGNLFAELRTALLRTVTVSKKGKGQVPSADGAERASVLGVISSADNQQFTEVEKLEALIKVARKISPNWGSFAFMFNGARVKEEILAALQAVLEKVKPAEREDDEEKMLADELLQRQVLRGQIESIDKKSKALRDYLALSTRATLLSAWRAMLEAHKGESDGAQKAKLKKLLTLATDSSQHVPSWRPDWSVQLTERLVHYEQESIKEQEAANRKGADETRAYLNRQQDELFHAQRSGRRELQAKFPKVAKTDRSLGDRLREVVMAEKFHNVAEEVQAIGRLMERLKETMPLQARKLDAKLLACCQKGLPMDMLKELRENLRADVDRLKEGSFFVFLHGGNKMMNMYGFSGKESSEEKVRRLEQLFAEPLDAVLQAEPKSERQTRAIKVAQSRLLESMPHWAQECFGVVARRLEFIESGERVAAQKLAQLVKRALADEQNHLERAEGAEQRHKQRLDEYQRQEYDNYDVVLAEADQVLSVLNRRSAPQWKRVVFDEFGSVDAAQKQIVQVQSALEAALKVPLTEREEHIGQALQSAKEILQQLPSVRDFGEAEQLSSIIGVLDRKDDAGAIQMWRRLHPDESEGEPSLLTAVLNRLKRRDGHSEPEEQKVQWRAQAKAALQRMYAQRVSKEGEELRKLVAHIDSHLALKADAKRQYEQLLERINRDFLPNKREEMEKANREAKLRFVQKMNENAQKHWTKLTERVKQYHLDVYLAVLGAAVTQFMSVDVRAMNADEIGQHIAAFKKLIGEVQEHNNKEIAEAQNKLNEARKQEERALQQMKEILTKISFKREKKTDLQKQIAKLAGELEALLQTKENLRQLQQSIQFQQDKMHIEKRIHQKPIKELDEFNKFVERDFVAEHNQNVIKKFLRIGGEDAVKKFEELMDTLTKDYAELIDWCRDLVEAMADKRELAKVLVEKPTREGAGELLEQYSTLAEALDKHHSEQRNALVQFFGTPADDVVNHLAIVHTARGDEGVAELKDRISLTEAVTFIDWLNTLELKPLTQNPTAIIDQLAQKLEYATDRLRGYKEKERSPKDRGDWDFLEQFGVDKMYNPFRQADPTAQELRDRTEIPMLEQLHRPLKAAILALYNAQIKFNEFVNGSEGGLAYLRHNLVLVESPVKVQLALGDDPDTMAKFLLYSLFAFGECLIGEVKANQEVVNALMEQGTKEIRRNEPGVNQLSMPDVYFKANEFERKFQELFSYTFAQHGLMFGEDEQWNQRPNSLQSLLQEGDVSSARLALRKELCKFVSIRPNEKGAALKFALIARDGEGAEPVLFTVNESGMPVENVQLLIDTIQKNYYEVVVKRSGAAPLPPPMAPRGGLLGTKRGAAVPSPKEEVKKHTRAVVASNYKALQTKSMLDYSIWADYTRKEALLTEIEDMLYKIFENNETTIAVGEGSAKKRELFEGDYKRKINIIFFLNKIIKEKKRGANKFLTDTGREQKVRELHREGANIEADIRAQYTAARAGGEDAEAKEEVKNLEQMHPFLAEKAHRKKRSAPEQTGQGEEERRVQQNASLESLVAATTKEEKGRANATVDTHGAMRKFVDKILNNSLNWQVDDYASALESFIKSNQFPTEAELEPYLAQSLSYEEMNTELDQFCWLVARSSANVEVRLKMAHYQYTVQKGLREADQQLTTYHNLVRTLKEHKESLQTFLYRIVDFANYVNQYSANTQQQKPMFGFTLIALTEVLGLRKKQEGHGVVRVVDIVVEDLFKNRLEHALNDLFVMADELQKHQKKVALQNLNSIRFKIKELLADRLSMIDGVQAKSKSKQQLAGRAKEEKKEVSMRHLVGRREQRTTTEQQLQEVRSELEAASNYKDVTKPDEPKVAKDWDLSAQESAEYMEILKTGFKAIFKELVGRVEYTSQYNLRLRDFFCYDSCYSKYESEKERKKEFSLSVVLDVITRAVKMVEGAVTKYANKVNSARRQREQEAKLDHQLEVNPHSNTSKWAKRFAAAQAKAALMGGDELHKHKAFAKRGQA